MDRSFYFTSESVSEGHPDKIADQISDSVLDAILAQDPEAHVACESYVKTGLVLVGGEIKTSAWVDLEEIARNTLYSIGYTAAHLGIDYQSCAVLCAMGKQSPDIAQGVAPQMGLEQGAGDQGLMFGYACDETDVLMPAPITFAHRMMRKQAELRKKGQIAWLRPDAKCQVTMRYINGKPAHVDTVVLSTQHEPEVPYNTIRDTVIEEIIFSVISPEWRNAETKYLINPTGRFVIGGPQGDCGLTGRKIIVDSYGGMARHGGGAFSGKDPSKVDRSAAYMARYLAKNIVTAGLAKRCELQIAYAIGIAKPVAVYVDTFGTSKIPEATLEKKILETIDLRPRAIIERLDLLRPIYAATSVYGHFGRTEPTFTWENTDLAKELG